LLDYSFLKRKIETMTKAATYRRRSTSGNNTQKNSLRIQQEVIEMFAATNGYEIVENFSDSKTGTNNLREGFQSALEWLRQDKDRVLIIRNASRCARNLSVWAEIEDLIPQLRFVELGDQEPNLLVLSVLLSMAAQESRNISNRVKAAYKSIKAVNPDHKWGNKEALMQVRAEGEAVRIKNANEYASKIVEINNLLEASGVTTLREKAERMNAMGFTSRRGGRISFAGLQQTLKRAERLGL
jgi:DNA invertase Pin-like site-specific DNA recombinase